MTVVEVAKSYLGRTELPQNSGWSDKLFQKKMEEVGWEKGQAYCSYFCELCYKEANQKDWWKLENLFHGSAVQTFKNFKNAGYQIFDKPFVGGLVIYKKYVKVKADWRGHAAICYEVIDDIYYRTYDANTTPDNQVGDQREGYIIAPKKKKLKKDVNDGLRFIGCIKIP
jgi:hypothetical protein